MKVLHAIDQQQIQEMLAARQPFWLDVPRPDPAQLHHLATLFALHPLAVEDTQDFGQRPKLDEYDDEALLVFFGIHDGTPREVHLHLGGGWIVTVHQDADALLAPVAERMATDPRSTYEESLYRILDQLADSFFPELEAIDDVIDALMNDMIERPSADQRQRLFELRRQLVSLRRIVGPQRDLLVRSDVVLERLPGVDRDEARHWLRDIYDHQLRIAEQIDAERDLLSGALDVYLSTVSNRLNQVSKQLTVVATIFLPLTFVTGFFGQNFGSMVRHINTPAAFWGYGVGGLLVSGMALLWWFRRSGFLGD